MTIKLTPDIESALAEAAHRQGTTPELLALDCLRDRLMPPKAATNVEGRTLGDFLAGHIGILASSEIVPGGAKMSEHTGKRFAEGMVEKRLQGRL